MTLKYDTFNKNNPHRVSVSLKDGRRMILRFKSKRHADDYLRGQKMVTGYKHLGTLKAKKRRKASSNWLLGGW